MFHAWQDGKRVHCKYFPFFPYKALEKFSKALYGDNEKYLQCTSCPSCHGRLLFLGSHMSFQVSWVYQENTRVFYWNTHHS